jgi:predicted acylesterase/phospholipase RssA
MTKNRPTIGLALRGASSRSVFYIGFLEVLHEQGIPIDYIAAMSGGAIVAASYACGTLNQLREMALGLNKELISSLIEKSASKSGVYHLDRVEEFLRVYTRNQKFEEVQPLMGFIAVDINKGEEVVLSMGDIAHAARASCTLPWIFEPVAWGNRLLVDGGIMNIIPGDVVQQAGIDIVIGVDLRNTDYIFGRPQVWAKRVLNTLKRLLLLNQAEKFWQQLAQYLDKTELFNRYADLRSFTGPDYPGKYGVLGRSMDLALAAEQKHPKDSTYGCNLLIRPAIRHLSTWQRFFHLDILDFSHTKELYELGRKTAEEYAPKIWQLMADYEAKQKQADQALAKLARQNQEIS